MSLFLAHTAEESDGGAEPKTTGIVFFVLCYDDLCARATLVLPPLVEEGAGFFVGRAAAPGLPRVEHAPHGTTLALPDAFVSQRHARFFRRSGADFVEDLGSKHGTFVEGERVASARRLVDGDLVEVGHSMFVYRFLEPSVAARSVVQTSGLSFGPTRTYCPELMTLVHRLRRIAATNEPILILGETGTGKEIAARFVHEKSERKGPLVAIDCGAIPPHLVEGELFGHRRGAFSGATEARRGRLRSAEGGTAFLDEIGNLPEPAQASLLRVLQEREVLPVGADRPEPLDARFVAATNADLFADESRFRSDLRARLAGFVARLPTLRARREDLGVLTGHFLEKAGVTRASITKRAARLLFGGELPGNVRELERALSSATVMAGDRSIDIGDLSALVEASRSAGAGASPRGERVVAEVAEDEAPERGEAEEGKRRKRPPAELIEDALSRAGRNQSEAARLLGVSERQLVRWMDAFGILRAKKSGGDDPAG